MRDPSFRDLEVLVVLGLDILLLNVLLDHLIRHVPTRGHEVPTSPEMPAPELLPQRPKILEETMRRLALDGLHHLARSQSRRHADQEVNMIGPHVPLQYLDILRLANLDNELTHPAAYLPSKHRFAVLRDEHEVIVEEIHAVRPFSVRSHIRIVPQTS